MVVGSPSSFNSVASIPWYAMLYFDLPASEVKGLGPQRQAIPTAAVPSSEGGHATDIAGRDPTGMHFLGLAVPSGSASIYTGEPGGLAVHKRDIEANGVPPMTWVLLAATLILLVTTFLVVCSRTCTFWLHGRKVRAAESSAGRGEVVRMEDGVLGTQTIQHDQRIG